VDPIPPIGRQDRTVPPVDLPRLRPLDRDEERRQQRGRKRPQRPPDAPPRRSESGTDGIDVRA
jgi:hypothetical protein